MTVVRDPDQLRREAEALRTKAETAEEIEALWLRNVANQLETIADQIEALSPEMRADLDAMISSLTRH